MLSLRNSRGLFESCSAAILALAVSVLLGACQKANHAAADQPAQPANEAAAPSKPEGSEGVKLTPEERQKIGIITQAAKEVEYPSEAAGFAVVQEHQSLAQVVADVQTAETTALFSKHSLERARQLKGTPGALSADLEQSAEQKEAIDSTALALTRQKLSALWGSDPPWKDNIHDPRVVSLSHGTAQLVRVSLPLSTLTGIPKELRAAKLGAARIEATMTLSPVWAAPADANIPGPSLFALLPAGTAAEGEHLQAWVPTGPAVSGVLVPSAAVMMSGGLFWCYVEHAPGSFVRVKVDPSRPVSGGYVVLGPVKVGDAVVTSGAPELLGKESGSSDQSD